MAVWQNCLIVDLFIDLLLSALPSRSSPTAIKPKSTTTPTATPAKMKLPKKLFIIFPLVPIALCSIVM